MSFRSGIVTIGDSDYNPFTKSGRDYSYQFSRAFDRIRENQLRLYDTTHLKADVSKFAIKVYPGIYPVRNPINCTELTLQNLVIDCEGAVLLGQTPGKPVVDMMGTRYATVKGLTVFGDPDFVPRSPVQIGRIDSVAAVGNMEFQHFTSFGEFSLAGFDSLACETTNFKKCRFQNHAAGVDTFAFLGDGRYHWPRNPFSDFVTPTISPQTDLSYTLNSYEGCEFRKYVGGSSVWLARTNGFRFDDACYYLSFDNSNFRLWVTAASRHRDLQIHGSFETSTSPGVKNAIEFEGDASNTKLHGLSFASGLIQVSEFVFKATNTGEVKLRGAYCEGELLEHANAKWFDGPNKISYVGTLNVDDQTDLNTADLVSFAGDIISDTGIART